MSLAPSTPKAVPAAKAGLSVFRDPTSVTVVGASADPAKWGYWLARGALAGAHRRTVHLVNRNGADVGGHACVAGIDGIEGDLDLVVLCVPPSGVEEAVDRALAKGARGFLGITAGLDAALGRPGAERALATRIRTAGARIVGPNSLGIYDAAADLQLAWGRFQAGSLGIVSQSGQLGSELSLLAAERGLGVSRFISVGNQVDVDAGDMLMDLVDHAQTRVIALYVESFADGTLMLEAMRELRHAGKPVILLTVGAGEASRSAARSHTGSMTSALDVVDAACRAAGAIRVSTPAELVEVAHMLSLAPAPAGPRVAILGDSGGQGALAADVIGARGLRVQGLTAGLRGRLAAVLPAEARTENPIDLAGAGEKDLAVYAEVVEALLADEEVDSVVVTGYFGSYAVHTPQLMAAESAAAHRIGLASVKHGKPVALHAMSRSSAALDVLRGHGVPAYSGIESAAAALEGSLRLAASPGRPTGVGGLGETPEPGTVAGGYLAARALLAGVGVGFPAARRVACAADLRGAAAVLNAPYVLKADWIRHKTEAGAVAVSLANADVAVAALAEMEGRLGPGDYVLEEMDQRPDTVEMIVGVRRDPAFGPVLMVGAGGVQAELFADTALELAPVDRPTAEAMLHRLRSHRLLTGWRGKPAVDIETLADILVAVSGLLGKLPGCTDIEINPLRVGPGGILAVDALITAGTETDTSTEKEFR